MQARKRMAEEAPSSSRLELLLLNLPAFPLLHWICFCSCCCWFWACGCICLFLFIASSTLDTIISLSDVDKQTEIEKLGDKRENIVHGNSPTCTFSFYRVFWYEIALGVIQWIFARFHLAISYFKWYKVGTPFPILIKIMR